MRAIHRLNLILLPPEVEQVAAVAPILAALQASEPDKLPAPRVEQGPVRFYAPGAFRVFCPEAGPEKKSGENVTAAFVPALAAWRAGGARDMACACGQRHALEALRFVPPCAFAATAIVLPDRDPAPPPAVEDAAQAAWGGLRCLLQRG